MVPVWRFYHKKWWRYGGLIGCGYGCHNSVTMVTDFEIPQFAAIYANLCRCNEILWLPSNCDSPVIFRCRKVTPCSRKMTPLVGKWLPSSKIDPLPNIRFLAIFKLYTNAHTHITVFQPVLTRRLGSKQSVHWEWLCWQIHC